MPVRTMILCYHNLVRESRAPADLEALLAVPAIRFAGHLDFLAARYEAGTLDVAERRDSGPRARFVLTFDDGYRSVLTIGLPYLKQRRIPAYLFVNPAFVGGWNPRDLVMGLALYGSRRAVDELSSVLEISRPPRPRERLFPILRAAMWRALRRRGETVYADIRDVFNRHEDVSLRERLRDSRLLSWDELRVLRAQGFRIGNHTQRHLELGGLSRETVRSEIIEAQRLLGAEIKAHEPIIAYPRGQFDTTTVDEALRAGYRWGLTDHPGYVTGTEPTLSAPRVVVSPNDSVAALAWKISPIRLWARRSRPAELFRDQRSRRLRRAVLGQTDPAEVRR